MIDWLRHPKFAPVLLLTALWLGAAIIGFLVVGPGLGGWAPAVLTTCFGWDAVTRTYRLDTVLLVTLEPPLFALVVWFAYADELRAFLAARSGRTAALAAGGAFLASALTLGLGGQITTGAPAARANAPAADPIRDGRPAPTVVLTDHHGEPLSVAAAGRPIALTFVYTGCYASCPSLVALMKAAETAAPPGVLFVAITLDPERDTPEVLRAYAERWGLGPSWRLLTGERRAVESILDTCGVEARRLDAGEIVHANVIVLIDRAGRIAFTYRGRLPAAGRLAEALAQLAAEPV